MRGRYSSNLWYTRISLHLKHDGFFPFLVFWFFTFFAVEVEAFEVVVGGTVGVESYLLHSSSSICDWIQAGASKLGKEHERSANG